jgi:integrase
MNDSEGKPLEAADPLTTPFSEYAAAWLDTRVDLAERTVELYRWLLRRHIQSTFGAVPLGSISPQGVRAWHSGIAKERPTTAAKAYRLLSSILRTAVSDEILTKKPCQVRGAAVEKAPERPIASIAEVDALARAMPERLRIAVYLAAWCQLRRGEIRGLRRKDIDLVTGKLSVRVTKTTAMSGRTVVKEPNTRAGSRTIAVPAQIVDLLAVHLERFVPESLEADVVDASNRAMSYAWHKARMAIGRPDLRFHDLRHSGLTWSAATGASVAELMRRAGHASQAAALRYQHATDDRDRVLADALAGLAEQAEKEAREFLSRSTFPIDLSYQGWGAPGLSSKG